MSWFWFSTDCQHDLQLKNSMYVCRSHRYLSDGLWFVLKRSMDDKCESVCERVRKRERDIERESEGERHWWRERERERVLEGQGLVCVLCPVLPWLQLITWLFWLWFVLCFFSNLPSLRSVEAAGPNEGDPFYSMLLKEAENTTCRPEPACSSLSVQQSAHWQFERVVWEWLCESTLASLKQFKEMDNLGIGAS